MLSQNSAFNPAGDLFIAQAERPDHMTDIDLQRLNNFQRALLVTDGTVTKFIEAYTMQPVNVVCHNQKQQPLDRYESWLAIEKDSIVTARKVSLHSNNEQQFLAYAESYILHNRLLELTQLQLDLGPSGIGKMLQETKLETYRELLWYGQEYLPVLPSLLFDFQSNFFLSRTYRILAGGKPIMLINERFPLTMNSDI